MFKSVHFTIEAIIWSRLYVCETYNPCFAHFDRKQIDKKNKKKKKTDRCKFCLGRYGHVGEQLF